MKILAIIAAAVIASTPATRSSTPFDGLSDEQLRQAVRAAATPVRLCGSIYGTGGLWEAFAIADNIDGRLIRDRFSDSEFPIPDIAGFAPDGMDYCEILPSLYWADSGEASTLLRYDLVNIVPCNSDVNRNKSSYPPGTVNVPYYSNSQWAAGEGMIDGEAVNYYQPPRGYEGDFARVCFYMLATYPADRWDISANNFIATSSLPCFRPTALRQLQAWHAADPVDDIERRRDQAIHEIQGNYNPFVRYPELAACLFGDNAGETFGETPRPPADDDNAPLRGVYRLGDKTVNLSSPHIPDDARWKIDGKDVATRRVTTESLGIGTHCLEYSAATSHGKLLIEITR